jgi:hypothetical protein
MKRANTSTVAPSRTPEQWSAIIAAWRESKQTARDFCSERGVNHKSFQWWRWSIQKREAKPRVRSGQRRVNVTARGSDTVASVPGSSAPAFIELARPEVCTVQRTAHPSGVEIIVVGVRGERRVKISSDFDEATLRRVVSLLEEV